MWAEIHLKFVLTYGHNYVHNNIRNNVGENAIRMGRKHGFDFVDLSLIFANPILEREDDRKDYGEKRYFGIGLLKDIEVAFIFTRRQNKIRIISARIASKNERKEYRPVYP